MFTGEDFNSPKHFAARNSPYLDHQMAPLQAGQNRNFPSYQSPVFALTGKPTYDFHRLNAAQQSGGLLKSQPLPCFSGIPFIKDLVPYDSQLLNTTQQIGLGGGLLKPRAPPYISGIPSIKSDFPCGFGANNEPVDLPPRKRFLIVDQSNDRMKLFYGPSLLPPLDQNITSKTPTDGDSSKRVEAQMDQDFSVNEEKWDENHSIYGEDTEEINALLYSDTNDDDDYDSGDDDDEVISPISDPSLSKDEDFIEEVASSDGSSRKRQRLLDGSYNQSSFASVGALRKKLSTSKSSEDDVASKCFLDKSSCNNRADSLNREKKVKIHKALQVLSSMIPGLKTKNPLSIIDSSIAYLESIKAEAEAIELGCYAECKLPSSP